MMKTARNAGTRPFVFVLALPLFLKFQALSAVIEISPEVGVRTEDLDAEFLTTTLSKRAVSLSITPNRPETIPVRLSIEGLDSGEYFLAISGSWPRQTNAEELAGGVDLVFPPAIGSVAAPFNRVAQEWKQRTERAMEVSDHHGYPRDQVPPAYLEIIDEIQRAADGLEEAARSTTIVLRVSPVGAGPTGLTALSKMTPIEIESRRQGLEESSKTLVEMVSEVDIARLREDVLATLVPLEVETPQGSALDLAKKGESGQGELSFQVSNPEANPAVLVDLETVTPKSWTPLSEIVHSFSMTPGETKEIPHSFEIASATPGRRVAIPLEIKVKIGEIEFKTENGFGFGHDFITEWNVIGPFPNIKNAAIDKEFPPETEDDLAAKYEGVGDRTLAWKKVNTDKDGYLNLAELLEPTQDTLAYASVWIHTPTSRNIICAAGSNDGMKVWVNDVVVHRFPGERGAQPEQDKFSARLRAGWNRLLVKVLQTGGEWGLYFEIRDVTGASPESLRVKTSPPW